MTTPRKRRNVGSSDAAVRAFASMNQDMVDLKKLFQPPNLDAFFQVDKMLDQFRLNHINMRQALLPPPMDSVAPFKDILTATNHFHDVLAKTSVSMGIGDMVHESWRELMSGQMAIPAQLNAAAKISLGENSLQLAATETFLAGIDFDFLKGTFNIPDSTISAMEQSIFDVTASYRTLAESIPDISELVQVPSFVLPGATYDLYTTGYALRALDLLDGDEDEEIEADASLVSVEYVENLDIVDLLNQVDPALVPMYSGACEDLYGGNPDRKRHVLVSLRELWIHLLDSIAPVGEVKDWIWKHGTLDDIDKNCRPKRHAKIRYILRGVNQKPLKDFVQDDATTFENLYQLYNKLHGKTPNLTEPQLLAIFRKTEAFLAYVIQIWLFAAT